MAIWLWSFLTYSFLGYLLEKWFAWRTRSSNQTRKGLLLLPLCPVYGLGLTAVLALPDSWRVFPWVLLTGGLVTTAVEYAYHWACEALLGVHFWDYTGVQGNLQGRVCLPFSLIWGVLSWVALWLIQPIIQSSAPWIPLWITYTALLVVTMDAVCSLRFLSITHDPTALHLRAIWAVEG